MQVVVSWLGMTAVRSFFVIVSTHPGESIWSCRVIDCALVRMNPIEIVASAASRIENTIIDTSISVSEVPRSSRVPGSPGAAGRSRPDVPVLEIFDRVAVRGPTT